eukprot:1227423-Rhodomonas_salina.1
MHCHSSRKVDGWDRKMTAGGWEEQWGGVEGLSRMYAAEGGRDAERERVVRVGGGRAKGGSLSGVA